MSRTPGQIQRFLADNMHRFDLPSQYLGDEPNSHRKPWETTTTRWCLVASWPYEQAAGNSSIPAVYKCVNDGRPDFLADRFYLPSTPRDMRILEKAEIPIFGIETKHPLRDFDIVATSISYPVLSMSFIKMLSMSDIPVRWKQREASGLENHPMVMVGGLSYSAPEVLAPVVDCWWLGEVEDEPDNPGIVAVTSRIAAFKADGSWQTTRLRCYETLAREFNFLYFPRFVDVHYDYEDRTHVGVTLPSKQVVGYAGNLDGMRLPLVKRFVKNLDNIAPLDNPPLLYADPAMGSGDLEVARGCPAWCSFCHLSYAQKPYRQRSVGKIVEYAKAMQDNMGAVRMAPFSPDFPMYTRRKELIAALLKNVSDEVDAPTMRVDDFIADDDFILLQVHGGMDSVTLGVEGNSQRMRDLVGKGTADADIKEAVTRGIRAGIRKFKLFMITNLPGEDEGDAMRILDLAQELADIRESLHQPTVRIQFSWTPLMIEAQTPFQWFAPTPPDSRILGEIFEEFRDLKIEFKIGAKAEANRMAFFQLCQRASRDVGEALVDAMLDADKACWGGVPRTFQETLDTKLREHGFHNGYGDCFDERFQSDMFGWEFVDQGISAELLWKTYLQMREFAEQTDSATYDANFDTEYHGAEWIERCDERCYGKACGVCDHQDLRIRQRYLTEPDIDVDFHNLAVVDQRSQAFRVRARVHKPEHHRFVMNDHWRFALRRAAFRAQRRLGLDHGIAKRSIRFASDEIKHRDWTCGTDYVEFGLTRPMTDTQIRDLIAAMNLELGDWMQLQAWQRHTAKGTTLRRGVDLNLFELEIDVEPEFAAAKVTAFRAADHVPMTLKNEGGYFAPATDQVNARDYVDDLWLIRDGHHLKLRMMLRGRPSPYNIYAALMGRASWLDAAKIPAVRLDSFIETDRRQQDFLRPTCVDCGLQVPTNILDEPWDPDRCPRCRDEHDQITITTPEVTVTTPVDDDQELDDGFDDFDEADYDDDEE